MLYTESVSDDLQHLPSPETLKRKILVKVQILFFKFIFITKLCVIGSHYLNYGDHAKDDIDLRA